MYQTTMTLSKELKWKEMNQKINKPTIVDDVFNDLFSLMAEVADRRSASILTN